MKKSKSQFSAALLRKILSRKGRVVVKIGSSILTGHRSGEVSETILSAFASSIAAVQKKGVAVVLVTSGAIACGMRHLGFSQKPKKISELQACAAIGQPILMNLYQKALDRSGLQAGQILLTADDFNHRVRKLNARHTLSELLGHGIIPIINENDTVIVDEIRVGDNDNLSAMVATLVGADLLILLTDQDGFYTSDPRKDSRAVRIPLVSRIDRSVLKKASNTSTATSTGGMLTKLEAARKASRARIPTWIANGNDPQALKKVFEGADVGTLFVGGGS
jgi:glutamate 5-kinase